MCGRYTLHHTTDQVALRFDVEKIQTPVAERYNIAPTQTVAVITQEAETRVLDDFQWGLIPFWAKDPAIGSKMINARAETLAEKPSFKNALTRRRCLIPGDGFYEWKKEGGGKQPMHIQVQEGALFAFAGLWEEWKQPDGAPLRTCTIITTEPNDLMAPIHNRMPAVLRPEHEALWLDASLKNAPEILALLKPYPASEMNAYPVSRRVNAPMLDDADLLLPVGAAR